jgi:hypothetical protein
MTLTQFASLGGSIFAVVASKRQKHVAARKETDRLIDLCECRRGCSCALKADIDAAKAVEANAYAELRDAEAAYADYREVRCEG